MKKTYLRTLTKSQLFLIFTLFLFLLSSLPMLNTFRKLKATKYSLAQAARQTEELHLLSAEVGELEQDLHQQKTVIPEIEAKIPEHEDMPNLITELSLLADNCDIRISSLVVVGEAQINEGGWQTDLQLTIHGSYNQIKNYLGDLLHITRYVSIKTIELICLSGDSSDSPDGSANQWQADVGFSTFHWPLLDDTMK